MKKHSPRFELVKEFYESGLWGKGALKNAVEKKWITTAEYKELAGEAYKK